MKIKVFFITPYVRGGGAERVQISIMNSLDSAKYDVSFIVLSREAPPEELNSTIKSFNLNKHNAISALGGVVALLRKQKPQYVFTTSATVGYYLPLLKIFSKCKVIIRIAVPPSEKVNITFKSRIIKLISKISYRYVDEFIAQTNYMKNDFLKHYTFISSKRIRVVPNPVDFAFLRLKSADKMPEKLRSFFDNESIVIVAAGALYSVKGFDVLIKSFALLPEEIRVQCKLLIMGKERYEIGYSETLLNLIKQLNLENAVFLTGFVGNPYPLFKRANLYVLSSRTEGFPNVVLEALSLGTPVVATSCVDFEGVITCKNGCVVPIEDEVGMAAGILKVISEIPKPIRFEYKNFDYQEILR